MKSKVSLDSSTKKVLLDCVQIYGAEYVAEFPKKTLTQIVVDVEVSTKLPITIVAHPGLYKRGLVSGPGIIPPDTKGFRPTFFYQPADTNIRLKPEEIIGEEPVIELYVHDSGAGYRDQGS